MGYDTLSQAINSLKEEGYDQDFNAKEDCIECRPLDLRLSPEEFEVDRVFRFEGDSNPDDSSILFAISSNNGKVKGTLVDAYGAYSDPMNAEMIQKLRYTP